MADGNIRTLCARITVEHDPGKRDVLIAELTQLILRQYLETTELHGDTPAKRKSHGGRNANLERYPAAGSGLF